MKILCSLMLFLLVGLSIAGEECNSASTTPCNGGLGLGGLEVDLKANDAHIHDFDGLVTGKRVGMFYDFGSHTFYATVVGSLPYATFVGHYTAGDLTDPATYADFDVLIVFIGSNGGAPWGVATRDVIADQVSNHGLILLVWDRFVVNAENYIPAVPTSVRYLAWTKDAIDPTSPPATGSRAVSFPLTGNFASHGYVPSARMQELDGCWAAWFVNYEGRPLGDQFCDVEIGFGSGLVYYSATPMDFYYGGAFTDHFVNIMDYIVGGSPQCGGGSTCDFDFDSVCGGVTELRGVLGDFNAYFKTSVSMSSGNIDGRLAAGADISLNTFGVANIVPESTCVAPVDANDVINYGMITNGSFHLGTGRYWLGRASRGGDTIHPSVEAGRDNHCPHTAAGNAGLLNQYFGAGQEDGLDELSAYLKALSSSNCGSDESIYRICKSGCNSKYEYKWSGLLFDDPSVDLNNFDVFVIDIAAADWAAATWVQLPWAFDSRWSSCSEDFDGDAVVVFNIGGVNARLAPGVPVYGNRGCFASHAIMNFYEAVTMDTNGAYSAGFLLAPHAHIAVGFGDHLGDVAAARMSSNTHFGYAPFRCLVPEEPVDGEYDIELVPGPNFVLEGFERYVESLERAAERWEQVIVGDVRDLGGIDDVRIEYNFGNIDGPGQILGRAGPTVLRPAVDHYLTLQGIMEFDTSDIGSLSDAQLDALFLHEMGHVFGIGILWENFEFECSQCSDNNNPNYDPLGECPAAVDAFENSPGRNHASPTGLLVEQDGNPGTKCAHFDEQQLQSELMTGWLTVNPGTGISELSAITIGALEDLGYEVNYAAADAFTVPAGPLNLNGLGVIDGIHLGDDVIHDFEIFEEN